MLETRSTRILIKERMVTFLRNHFAGIGVRERALYLLPHFFVSKMVKKKLDNNGDLLVPSLFNEQGERIYVVYMDGINNITHPYTVVSGRMPRYLLWDNFNSNLKVHFYGWKNFERIKYADSSKTNCLYVLESESIIPKKYEYMISHPEIMNRFDYIFTASDKLLSKYKNALFCPASGVWYGTDKWGGKLSEEGYKKKCKNISMASTYKTRCPMHKFRYELAHYLKDKGSVDMYGTFDGGTATDLVEILEPYRYSIVIENNITDYYFTEKILNCFAAMTIPIYIGAKKISDFFNEDGIIRVSSCDIHSIEREISQCSKEDYDRRLEAVLDNYHRVKNYLSVEDFIISNYKDKLFN